MQIALGLPSHYTTGNRRPRRSAHTMQAGGVFLLLASALALQTALAQFSKGLYPTIGGAGTGQRKPAQARLITPTQTPALPPYTPACTLNEGTLLEDSIPITELDLELPFRAYLPPCYNAERPEGYPTLYLLHGLLGNDRQWEDAGAFASADALFSKGVVPPFILILPWERTGIDLEPALVAYLVPYVDQAFNTQPAASGRGIGGLSRGGGQALQIGLKHPDLFGQISLHSPAILHDDGLILGWLRVIPTITLPSIWIDIGERDPLFPTTMHLIDVLLENGYSPTLQINMGSHDLAYWEAHVETYLRWHGGLWLAQLMRAAAESTP